ncbi:arylsulfatase [Dyadobacter psychrotolerans]|uniref:N-acetylgalactosamine-6-sulfatase n=1 Tax=Dyadobacter psychrotolerans TaxID=2541721 RepID=A0A4R5DRK3_9BACT|nr:arylsulfatase [Dyadobacter psychrotolerans]TDE17066.1 N-acetylgalactosamine-6-sulfatase [Dyadobacter psychrotolerans]
MNFFRATFLILFFFSTGFAQKTTRKPNIIYIYADDLGYGELGCYGQTKIKTPNLDKLAKEGIRFTKHYTSTPVCAPARCMLLTGRHGGHSFIRGNYEMGGFADDKEGGQMPLPDGTVTIAKVLKNAGYVTGAFGKWGLGMANTTGNPNNQGFDYFYGYLDQKQAHNYYPTHLWDNGKRDKLNNPFIDVHKKLAPGAPDSAFNYFRGNDYAIDKIADRAQKFITENQDKPFFLYLPMTIPHVSLQVPDEAVKEYLGKFEEKPYYGEKSYASTKYPRATYAAMITYLDKQVGKIQEQIKKLGLDENTVIMFSSDNGTTFNGGTDAKFFNSVAGLRGMKMDIYEGGIREPFIARWPGHIKPGTTTDYVSVQYDIFATLSEIAGVESPPHSDGISLVPALTGVGKMTPREYLYFEFPEKSGEIAIRFERFKAVKSNVKINLNTAWELYDMQVDEKETKDIASNHPEIIQKLNGIVSKEHYQATLREWEFIDPKIEKK